MKKIIIFTSLLLFLTAIIVYKYRNQKIAPTQIASSDTRVDSPEDKIIADKLQIPWSLAFLPDQSILFTERPGRVRQISPSGVLSETPVSTISDVKPIGEGGLLGIAVHPNFSQNRYIYLYYTYSGNGNNTENKVVRYTYLNNQLISDKVIISEIPGSANHNGGRLMFGPDGFLYVTTGDSQEPSLSQDKISIAGKILRLTDDGKPAPGNPFDSTVYSYGHRNPQGLAWDEMHKLYSTEHGSSAGDELNLIELGKNYGWPVIKKTETRAGMETPLLNSGNETWAPSGLVYIAPYFYFAGLRSSTLYRFDPSTGKLDKFLKNKYGRLRDVVLGPDGMLYITTSNMDGRSITHLDGDKIIRINTSSLK